MQRQMAILIIFNSVQHKYEQLEENNTDLRKEKETNIEAILLLAETVKLLETRSPKVHQKTESVQTNVF